MAKALIIVHAPPEAADCRALTALRLAGALLADGKDVSLFLVEDGAHLADPKLGAENPCRALFYELLDVGLDVQVCGNTMKKLGWDQTYALPGITRGSMKALSALMSAADEIITF
ncbi:MAG: hypothetical protein H6R47_1169 [Proteobacteria bacterium]|nr:hypothetical protein [Pseudomonadota bacterium]